MEPEGTLPQSHVPVTCPYPEPVRSTLYPTPHFLEIHLNVILPYTPGSPKWSLTLKFPHQNPVHHSPVRVRATCPANLILLDLITRIILGVHCRSLRSLLCSFLQSLLTSSLLVPNILSAPCSQTYHHPVPLSRNLGTLTSWNPLGHSRPVMGLILPCSQTP